MATLTAQQLERVKADFKQRDLDNDGILTVEEYKEVLKPWYNSEDLEQHLKRVNTDNDKVISYAEFEAEYIRDLDS